MNRSMMQHAFAVLKLLEPIASENWWLESYSNGREQGFNLWTGGGKQDRRVSFSRSRGADDIVVYTGRYHDFSLQGNFYQVQPYTYINTFFFTNAQDAANFIFNYLSGITS